MSELSLLPFDAVWVKGYPGVNNGRSFTARCCAPGCGDKIKEERAVAVIFPASYVWTGKRYCCGDPIDGFDTKLIHEYCVREFEQGCDFIPPDGALVFANEKEEP
jgi:hypothetical protein